MTMAVFFLMATAPFVAAQPQPDAGQILQESQKPLPLPPAPTKIDIQSSPDTEEAAAGGPQVLINSVRFTGATSVDELTLLAVLGDYGAEPKDFAGIQGLADKITTFYRKQGYPVALAYLPPQNIQAGELVIDIVEGRYGDVRVTGDEELIHGAQNFVKSLEPGDVIRAKPLTRAVHILADQPGILIEPVLMPGQEIGRGDLEITVDKGPKFEGEVGLDNHGNRFSGDWRANAQLNINRLLTFGDRLDIGAMYTDENLWYGRVGYSLPVGYSGLRAMASYAHTRYDLGGPFSALDATGTADIVSLGLSYPLLRSMSTNVRLQGAYQYKELEDEDNTPTPDSDKSSNSLPLSLQFDHRDYLAGGGITWGMLTWTPGNLSLNGDTKEIDRLTARTDGGFQKINLEVSRIQRLPAAFSLFGRFSAQWADTNLDSSEGFSLGGANAVRAYPQSEAFGDTGWITQVELRYQWRSLTPYGFYDSGSIRYNTNPWDAGDNSRSISGGGAGLRCDMMNWSLDAAIAWRAWGGEPRSDTRGDQPRFWVSANYRF